MCEWLSCREWCDVRLVCGGRWFPAHRAVLASVSAFLRRILLSCHTEESPTSILLPDFDLEAMSSVLYYIYNGEVFIETKKLETFMEIIRAMQIFVDDQHLINACKSDLLNSSISSQTVYSAAKIFALGDDDGPYITLKKVDYNMRDVLPNHYKNNLDFQDEQIRCGGQDMNKSYFGNVQTTQADRQRSSFLRDLYIETYPRNGNANGRAAGVPAIPNECYRGAASALLTNANSNHLNVDDKSELQKKTFGTSEWKNRSKNTLPQHYVQNSLIRGTSLINLAKLSQTKTFDAVSISSGSKLLRNNCDMMDESRSIDGFTPRVDQTHSLVSRLTVRSINELKDMKDNNTKTLISTTKRNSASVLNNGLSKSAILNQVLESPWCPRQPNNFRPFRRKALNKSESPHDITKDNPVNDTNNNVQTQNPDVTQRISPNTTAESLYPNADGGDFKCNICNQVFTDPEMLSAHARRHSVPARYSCAECTKSFSQLRNFKYHMSIHRGTREFAATCSVCGKYFNDRGYLSSHMKIHRNRKEYKCSQCPKSFNQRVAYNMHVRIHTGIKPHVCGECGKAFSRKMLLKQHQRTHSGERPYACPHCDKRFADRSNMTLHLRLHTGIKPFSCTLCPKSFTKKHHLKSHLNFHTGAKPYSCPRCKLAFTQSSNMRTHLKKCKAPELTIIAETSTS